MRTSSVLLRRLRQTSDNSIILFLLGGALLYALTPRDAQDTYIALDPEQLAARAAAEAARLGVPLLSPEQEEEVRRRAIEDEILFREALRLGLDQGDSLIRQRLVQRMLFLAEDLAGAGQPATTEALKAFFQESLERWRQPSRTHFIHVYSSEPPPSSLGAKLRREHGSATAPPSLGDAYPLSREREATNAEVVAELGPEVARAMEDLPVGVWSKPLRSPHGWHLVRVLERWPAHDPSFEEVRRELELTYLVERKQKAVRAFLEKARSRYVIDAKSPGASLEAEVVK